MATRVYQCLHGPSKPWYWLHGPGLASFCWHLLILKSSLLTQTSGTNLLVFYCDLVKWVLHVVNGVLWSDGVRQFWTLTLPLMAVKSLCVCMYQVWQSYTFIYQLWNSHRLKTHRKSKVRTLSKLDVNLSLFFLLCYYVSKSLDLKFEVPLRSGESPPVEPHLPFPEKMLCVS